MLTAQVAALLKANTSSSDLQNCIAQSLLPVREDLVVLAQSESSSESSSDTDTDTNDQNPSCAGAIDENSDVDLSDDGVFTQVYHRRVKRKQANARNSTTGKASDKPRPNKNIVRVPCTLDKEVLSKREKRYKEIKDIGCKQVTLGFLFYCDQIKLRCHLVM